MKTLSPQDHPAFEAIRTSAKFPALLESLIGTSLKQYINQINFKMPDSNIAFPWHQDIRPTPAFSDQLSSYCHSEKSSGCNVLDIFSILFSVVR